MKIFVLALIGVLVACSKQELYEAIQHNQCLEQTGRIYCDEANDYEDYKREREELLKSK